MERIRNVTVSSLDLSLINVDYAGTGAYVPTSHSPLPSRGTLSFQPSSLFVSSGQNACCCPSKSAKSKTRLCSVLLALAPRTWAQPTSKSAPP
jgi:hypothetical protein